jgi:hypothetical protein
VTDSFVIMPPAASKSKSCRNAFQPSARLPTVTLLFFPSFSSTGNGLAAYRLFASPVRDRNQILSKETGSPILTDLQPGLKYHFLCGRQNFHQIQRQF